MNRRDVLKWTALASMWPALAAIADEPDTVVDPEGSQAQALGYTHNAETVDATEWPRFREGQNCVNCQLAQGDLSKEWMGCSIFPGQKVNGAGWCNAWVPRP